MSRGASTSPSAPPHIVNRVEVRVAGLSRSGNHPIIDWILARSPGRTCFLNCAEPGHNPFDWARPISETEDGARASYPDFERDTEARGRLSRKDLLVHSYEDVWLTSLTSEAEAAWIGPSCRRVDVLILRDPLNLFASRIASGFAWLDHDIAMRVWCEHAREFVGDTHHLRRERVLVSYDRWATSRDYRRQTGEELGLSLATDVSLSVSPTGGGSSFDGVRFDGRADRMPVLERWRGFLADEEYLALFTPEVLALRERAFGPLPRPLRRVLGGVGHQPSV